MDRKMNTLEIIQSQIRTNKMAIADLNKQETMIEQKMVFLQNEIDHLENLKKVYLNEHGDKPEE